MRTDSFPMDDFDNVAATRVFSALGQKLGRNKPLRAPTPERKTAIEARLAEIHRDNYLLSQIGYTCESISSFTVQDGQHYSNRSLVFFASAAKADDFCMAL